MSLERRSSRRGGVGAIILVPVEVCAAGESQSIFMAWAEKYPGLQRE